MLEYLYREVMDLKRIFVFFIAILITLSLLLPYFGIKSERHKKEVQEEKYKYSEKLNDISQRLLGEINQSFEYVEVLEMILEKNPNDIELIKNYSEIILEKHDLIYNIAIAPQGIVKYVYPLKGNEEALGHNLMADPKRSPFIKKAIDERRSIVQGPVDSIQGRSLVFSRKPVFNVEDGVEGFWGLLVVTLDFEKLISHIGVDMLEKDYFFSIRAFESDGYNDFKWGNAESFGSDSITSILNIENQKWELAIYPKGGWNSIDNGIAGLDGIDKSFMGLSIILFFFIFRHLNQYMENSRMAQIDLMTGALNKNTFEDKVVKGLKSKPDKIQSLIVIDINKFKSINDQYGHFVGDCVIIELSKRLQKVLRKEDLLARWGGDEFFIYLYNLNKISDINSIIMRIHAEVGKPIDVKNQSINIEIALGYAIYPEDGTSFQTLYSKADKMMYANKPEDGVK